MGSKVTLNSPVCSDLTISKTRLSARLGYFTFEILSVGFEITHFNTRITPISKILLTYTLWYYMNKIFWRKMIIISTVACSRLSLIKTVALSFG